MYIFKNWLLPQCSPAFSYQFLIWLKLLKSRPPPQTLTLWHFHFFFRPTFSPSLWDFCMFSSNDFETIKWRDFRMNAIKMRSSSIIYHDILLSTEWNIINFPYNCRCRSKFSTLLLRIELVFTVRKCAMHSNNYDYLNLKSFHVCFETSHDGVTHVKWKKSVMHITLLEKSLNKIFSCSIISAMNWITEFFLLAFVLKWILSGSEHFQFARRFKC